MINHYVRVGIVTAATLALAAVWTVRQTREQYRADSWVRFKVRFDDARGVVPGTEVLKAGVLVGRIGSVELDDTGRALMTLEVRRDAKIRQDARFILKEEIVGDTKMLVEDRDATGPFVNDDTPVLERGKLPLPIDDVMEAAASSIERVDELLANLNKIVGDREFEGDILRVADNMAGATEEAKELAKSLRLMSLENRENVDRILAGFASTAENADAASRNAVGTVESLDRAIEAAEKLIENVNELAGDQGFQKDVKKSAENLGEFMENVVGNEATQQDLRGSVEELRKAIRSINEILDAWKETATDPTLISEARDSVRKAHEMMEAGSETLRKVRGVVDAMSETETHPSFLFRYESRWDRYRADMDLKFVPPSRKVYYLMGLDDVGEDAGTNLQLGVFASNDSSFRFGLKRGKLGAGYERVYKDYLYQTDVLDPNNLQWNLRFGRKIGDNMYGLIGLEDILEKNSLSLSVYQRY